MLKQFSGIKFLLVIALMACSQIHAQSFQTVDTQSWNETAVRKVLHVFAYGGLATDSQINTWSGMPPRDAIEEILTFDPVNDQLAPTEDTTATGGTSLAELQSFWSSSDANNPTRQDRRVLYDFVITQASGQIIQSDLHLENTWIAAVNKRGLNPFPHKVGLWLTNYQMAVSLDTITPVLMRDLYDRSLAALAAGKSMDEILAIGATSAAVAYQYGHRSNRFNGAGLFRGNDDFAREFHQLFFLILGEGDDADYHENVTIEHTSWALTGMQLDQEPGAFGTYRVRDSWTAPIVFTNHYDLRGRNVRNVFWHYDQDLEILHQTVSGTTAEERLIALTGIAIEHPESLNNMPVSIINFFADDNLNPVKIAAIQNTWKAMPNKDLLKFLQDYAISTIFHQGDSYKFRTAFSRNMMIYNLMTVDNTESYVSSFSPRTAMQQQGAIAFKPAHNVFGGQTSLNAANSSNLFQAAYNRSVDNPNNYARTQETYTDANGVEQIWRKDWSRHITVDSTDDFNVDKVGEWLWQRFISDGLINYGLLERTYVNSLLATGLDIAYNIDPANPDIAYTAADFESDQYSDLIESMKDSQMALDSGVTNVRSTANRRVGNAIRFIVATPFAFLIEGSESNLADTDNDGVADIYDNCLLVANGTLDNVTAGESQNDTDGDGFGNICDPDLSNDNLINFQDVALFSNVFLTNDPHADFNGDGIVNFSDFIILTQMFLTAPGPSGYVQ